LKTRQSHFQTYLTLKALALVLLTQAAMFRYYWKDADSVSHMPVEADEADWQMNLAPNLGSPPGNFEDRHSIFCDTDNIKIVQN